MAYDGSSAQKKKLFHQKNDFFFCFNKKVILFDSLIHSLSLRIIFININLYLQPFFRVAFLTKLEHPA